MICLGGRFRPQDDSIFEKWQFGRGKHFPVRGIVHRSAAKSFCSGTQSCDRFASSSRNERVRRPVSRVLSSPFRAMDGHSSGTPVAERLARPTRAAARKPACRLPGVPPLFGLAPGGVCRAACVAARAVGSYPTVSPLPRRRTGLAVCSLWHFPWGRPRRPLAGTVSPWSPDFPHPLRSAAIQPSDPRPS